MAWGNSSCLCPVFWSSAVLYRPSFPWDSPCSQSMFSLQLRLQKLQYWSGPLPSSSHSWCFCDDWRDRKLLFSNRCLTDFKEQQQFTSICPHAAVTHTATYFFSSVIPYGQTCIWSKIYFHYQFRCLIFSRVIDKMSENGEKCPSQFPKAQGEVFKRLVLSNEQFKPKEKEQICTIFLHNWLIVSDVVSVETYLLFGSNEFVAIHT